jgi:hypothetical protein
VEARVEKINGMKEELGEIFEVRLEMNAPEADHVDLAHPAADGVTL